MSSSSRIALTLPVPPNLRPVTEVRARQSSQFSLADWRLWAASFLFFWTLCICGAISMYSLQRVGGSRFKIEEILILPIIQDTIFAILAPLVFVFATRYPVQRPHRTQR